MKQTFAILALGAVVLTGAIWFSLKNPPKTHPKLSVPPEVTKARDERREADALYGAKPKEAEAGYREFIKKNEGAKSPQVQDEVGSARVRLGFLAAKRKDFGEAHLAFKEAEKKYKGTGAMGADFGGIRDQAAYQAAVCLSADGKKEEAHAAYTLFLKDYKLSPLVHAVHRRLTDMDAANSEAYDKLLQAAITAQEKHIRFETSVCGPKAIAYILTKLGKEEKDYKEFARLCGTTDAGTTMDGLKKGLHAVGLQGFGYVVNREDLLRLKPLSILLTQEHYVVLLGFTSTDALVYDPIRGGEAKWALPKEQQTDFTIPVLTLQPLEDK